MKRSAPGRKKMVRKKEGAYQLKITLVDSEPAIWRRVLVPAGIRLSRLHDVIQMVMPWTNSHLHQFTVGDVRYEVPHEDNETDLFGMESRDEHKFALCEVLPEEKSRLLYEYDFGDGWEHDLLVEKILPAGEDAGAIACLAGENACPPDDCGGIPGYYRMLEILTKPRHPEYRDLRDWLGKGFDPSRFDLKAADAALRTMR